MCCFGPEECVEETLATARRTRVETLERAASSPCVCNGEWCAAVVESFLENRINVRDLCRDVLKALTIGRDESVPVVVFAGNSGGEGKSLFLKGLWAAFGHEWVFPKPLSGSFPLVDLPGKKVCFLDDWRFDQAVLDWGTQCLWYDGSIVPVCRPQNQPGVQGHLLYAEKAPIFATTKLENIEALEKAAMPLQGTDRPLNADASMIRRRLRVYPFFVKARKPDEKIPYCGRCFSELVLNQGRE